jgi:hypothetical protein
VDGTPKCAGDFFTSGMYVYVVFNIYIYIYIYICVCVCNLKLPTCATFKAFIVKLVSPTRFGATSASSSATFL